MDEWHIDRHRSLSGPSCDATDRDDLLPGGDEFLGDEANIEDSIEAREKALEHVLETLEMTGSNRHAFRQILYDM